MIQAYLKSNGKYVTLENLTADATLQVPCAYPLWDAALDAWVFDRSAWLTAEVRPARDKALRAADDRVRRYDLQLRASIPTSETSDKIEELLQYMQLLRDLPNNEALTPENLAWPEVP